MRFIEPIIRPRPLAWAAAAIGALLSFVVVMDPATPPLTRVLLPFVLVVGLPFIGMVVHAMCMFFLKTEVAGELCCSYLLPSDDLMRSWTDSTEWSHREVRLGRETSPIGILVTMAWMAPEPISWRDQLEIIRIVWWRPLPALIIAPMLIGCTFFLVIWDVCTRTNRVSNQSDPSEDAWRS